MLKLKSSKPPQGVAAPLDQEGGGYEIVSGRQSLDSNIERPEKIGWEYIKGMIPQIELYVATQGDFARVLSDLDGLTGTGMTVVVAAQSQEVIVRAQHAINRFARAIRPETGGLLGIIQECLWQLYTAGGISIEWECQLDGETAGRIVAAHRVDIASLDMEWDDSLKRWLPVQLIDGKTYPLKYPNYQLAVLRALHPKPLPLPPLLAAMHEVGKLEGALTSVERAIKKLGLVGLITLEVDRPQKYFWETELAYASRVSDHLKQIHAVMQQGVTDGIVTHYSTVKSPKVMNFAGEVNNSVGVLNTLDNRLARSLGIEWNDQSYKSAGLMNVLYDKMLSKLRHSQQLLSMVLETGLFLEVLLQNIPILDIKADFQNNTQQSLQDLERRVKVFIEMVGGLGYDQAKALRHLGYDEKEEATFPLSMVDILSKEMLHSFSSTHTGRGHQPRVVGVLSANFRTQRFEIVHVTSV